MLASGFTWIEAPKPTKLPPHVPEYHFHCAPVPSVPPDTERVVWSPEHRLDTDADADVGLTENTFTFTLTDMHNVVLQSPAART